VSRDAIEVLVHRYADAVVRRDAEQWASTWAVEGVWSFAPGREITGRDAVVSFWLGAMAAFDAAVQQVHNGDAVLDGEHGTGRWHLTEHYRLANGTVGLLLAHYDDTYVQEDGAWRFASRTLVPHYQGPPDLSGTWTTAY
jgi:ketosteroid isomerase-like protein